MKYLLGLFLAITFLANAQYQFEFPAEGADWVVCESTPFNHKFYRLVIEGDTIVNGAVYKKIYREYLFSAHPDGPNDTDYFNVILYDNDKLYDGAIRIDSLDQVYFLDDHGGEEVIYCFGDTCEKQGLVNDIPFVGSEYGLLYPVIIL